MRRSSVIVLLLAGLILLATSWVPPSAEESREAYPTAQPSLAVDDAGADSQGIVTQAPQGVGRSADLVESYRVLATSEPATPIQLPDPIPTPAPETAAPLAPADHPFGTAEPIPPAEVTATAGVSPPAPLPALALPTSTTSRLQPAETTRAASPTTTSAPTSTPTETAEPIERDIDEVALPKLLRLPAVGIEAAFEYVGLTPDGAMDTPKNPDKVAWYQFGPRPGQPGNAVIAGHVDWAGKVRAFWWLNSLGPGDLVEIIDQNDRSYSFVIQWKRMYDVSTAPLQEIFAASDTPEITLITCGGVFDQRTKQYISRLVVRAALQ